MTNVFGDIERESEDEMAAHLAMAEDLDKMERDVNSWEAGFLESVLVRLKKEKLPLTETQVKTLKEMHEKYGF